MTATTRAVPLLMTKLSVPRVQSDLVARARVFERLEEGLQRSLTLISAPAGFGKTTLVTSWLHSTPRAALQLAWLSLDERDNDIERFLTYLTASLHAANPAIGGTAGPLIETFASSQPELVVTQLINDIGAQPDQIVLVLDDYHTLENREIHEALDYLLENAPAQLHIVITTRADPPLALSRLRGRGKMTDIRAADLRFTSEETARFIQTAFGREIESADIHELERRTEGWVTGLQLAAISMRDSDDVHRFIQSFSGQHHHIFDYLADEALNRQTPAIQTFLLQTSLFSQFTADLCDAVTLRDDSYAVLAYLERSNLFIASLDSERRWFRYHHLFADLLRRRLRQAQPDMLAELRRRASVWFEEHDDPVEAIWQAVNGEDWHRVGELLKHYERRLFNEGRSKTLLRMLHGVPDEIVQSNPWMVFIRATSYDLNGEAALCARDSTTLEELLERIADDPQRSDELTADEHQHLRASLARTRAFIAVLDNDYPAVRRLCNEALDQMPADAYDTRALTTGIRAQGHWLTGDLETAATDLRSAIEMSKLVDAAAARMVGLLGLGSLEVEWGHLDRAAELYDEAIAYAAGHGLATWQYTGRIMSFQSEVPYERNDLKAALKLAQRGRELAGHWASHHAYDVTHLHLARVQYALGDIETARSTLRLAPPYSGLGPGMTTVAQIEALLALYDLASGHREQLDALEGELLTPVAGLADRIWLWTPAVRTRAQVLNASGRYADAVTLLEPIADICRARGWTRQAVQTGAVLALAHHGLGDQPAAVATLERTLADAAPHGFLRSILDAGDGIDVVLKALLGRRREEGADSVYLNRLLRLARAERELRQGGAAAAQPGLAEPLSERELGVLRLIAAGYTNAEIADELFVVIGTIKSHAHNIYGKLGVRNRTQAINRGRELGLVD